MKISLFAIESAKLGHQSPKILFVIHSGIVSQSPGK